MRIFGRDLRDLRVLTFRRTFRRNKRKFYDDYSVGGLSLGGIDRGGTSWADTPNEAVNKVPHVYACVRIITQKIASIPTSIRDVKGNPVDKANAKFLYGNPWFSWQEVIQITQAQNELKGFTVWDLSKDFINPLDSDFVFFIREVTPDPTVPYKVHAYYFYWGQQVELDLKKIAIFRNLTVRPYITGLSTISAAMGGVELTSISNELNVNLLRNGAMVPVVLQTAHDLNDTQKQSLKEQWGKRYSGVDNAGKTPVLPPGVVPVKLGLSPVDLGILDNIKIGESQIATAFGVPSLFLNDLANTKYDSAAAQERIFTRYTIIPKCESITDTINMQVLPIMNFGNYKFQFDYDQLEELQMDRTQQSQIDDINIKNGSLTINDKRARDGEAPYPWGNEYWGNLSQTSLGTNTPAKGLAEVVGKLYTLYDDMKKSFTEEKKELIWKAFVARTTPQENKFKSELRKLFERQEKEFAESIKQFTGINAVNAVETKAFDWSKWEELFRKMGKPYFLAFAQQAIDAAKEQYAFDIVFDLQSAAAMKKIDEKVLKFAKEVNDTTKEALKKELKEALDNGESIPQISERVAKVFDEAKSYRTERIARTEVIGDNNWAQTEEANVNGMQYKTWLAALDERTREAHAAADGQTVAIDEPFIVDGEELDYPGDSNGSPDNIINCRCTCTYSSEEG